ncbi:CoA transferase [Fulvimonas soli]|jgi:crotonobetainyl-CoA:carnitine CoA-transferase CaiB-like acyl-CoA transferase|uniref:Crotonobetainyl-CoA:carnitine CoA-transferase CaiB-like acyl-CoA transferase n=1 Tax=Fulvimonas soli TaxID=155197 RepID=A0A316IG15_9GAMM|nr:CoA transferase [Fulvimonas soli]PWK92442.1 crotonobetainyl-CoA:carnitine CoA-transferase CaiB-like acyl-CoA transferase [Fulvimonas soli]TNY26260.1 CoA transferase [Fulvimonas soli]
MDTTPPDSNAARGRGPLAGIRVLDLSAYIAGPYGCTLLADQGADVIKIEPPGGDNLRQYPSTLPSESRAFLGVNRSKRGVVLDLKRAEDHAALLRLVREADVLVHNFRPSVPPRLGIDHPRLARLNPRLIYCAVTGYGERGPMKDKAGYDQVLQTMTGMCALQGKRGGPPEIIYGSVVDYYAAALLAAGVASALYERERSGLGQFVGVSLLRSALTMQSARMIWAEGEALDIGRDMRSGGVTGIHPTREGYLYLSANTPRFWKALCEKTGLQRLHDDPRYDTVRKRAERYAEIVPQLHAALAARSALEWEALFGDEVPCAAARRIEDMFDHPQVLAEGMVAGFEHPAVGRYRGVAHPIKFGRTPGPAAFAAPLLDQDAAAILGRAAAPRRDPGEDPGD